MPTMFREGNALWRNIFFCLPPRRTDDVGGRIFRPINPLRNVLSLEISTINVITNCFREFSNKIVPTKNFTSSSEYLKTKNKQFHVPKSRILIFLHWWRSHERKINVYFIRQYLEKKFTKIVIRLLR